MENPPNLPPIDAEIVSETVYPPQPERTKPIEAEVKPIDTRTTGEKLADIFRMERQQRGR